MTVFHVSFYIMRFTFYRIQYIYMSRYVRYDLNVGGLYDKDTLCRAGFAYAW